MSPGEDTWEVTRLLNRRLGYCIALDGPWPETFYGILRLVDSVGTLLSQHCMVEEGLRRVVSGARDRGLVHRRLRGIASSKMLSGVLDLLASHEMAFACRTVVMNLL